MGLIPTGVEALDNRLGGLRSGGAYVVQGPAAAGKSVLGLHFVVTGLERNEDVVLLTREEPAAIDGRAMFIGHSPGRLTEHPRLRVIRPPAALPVRAAPTTGEPIVEWLAQQLDGLRPRRVVLDDAALLDVYTADPRLLHAELVRFLGRSGATTLLLQKTDPARAASDPAQPVLVERADGVFRLQVGNRGERTFLFHAAPSGTFRTDPFPYALRIGAGFTEEHPAAAPDIDPADRRRVVVLDDIGAVPLEVLSSLAPLYDVVQLHSAAGALTELSAGRYGALVVAVDPFDEARAFDLVFALRREGNAAPIIMVAPSRGLRSTTRSRGLRVGGDDFFVADLPPAEIVERIQMAWMRGGHRRTGLSQLGQIVQPVNGDGMARPMTESEFLDAMRILLAEQPPLFFCYLEFRVPDATQALVWPALRTRVRIADGDIIGALGDGRFACILDRITPDQTERVIDRIRAGHAALHALTDTVMIASPMHADAIRARLFRGGRAVAEAISAH